jgi:hypothetical protein
VIHQKNLYVPPGKQRTSHREAQSHEPVNRVKKTSRITLYSSIYLICNSAVSVTAYMQWFITYHRGKLLPCMGEQNFQDPDLRWNRDPLCVCVRVWAHALMHMCRRVRERERESMCRCMHPCRWMWICKLACVRCLTNMLLHQQNKISVCHWVWFFCGRNCSHVLVKLVITTHVTDSNLKCILWLLCIFRDGNIDCFKFYCQTT